MTLLIVDDEPIIRKGIKELVDFTALEIDTVVEASDGETAIKVFQTAQPDLVLLDINLPHINGLDLAERFKAQSPRVKIAMMTGYDYLEYALSAIKIGVDEYLLKPVSKDDVTAVILKLKKQMAKQSLMAESGERQLMPSDDSDYGQEMYDIIAKAYSDHDFSLTQLAQDMCLSPSYVSSLFKQHFGLAFQDYLLKLRLEKARVLVLSTHLKNYEIAERVGFEDANYFGTRFKQKFGLSPGQYRQKSKG